ncbi:MAG: hypothetical protein CTY35_15480 [Methylotenera sp.]|nr:MAG: hypothetical protein CTY35_15480 [Methylotenera sp.]
MLGWEIFIHTEFTESTDQAEWHWPKDETILATWRTSVGGIEWLNQLVKEDKAKFLGGAGYPIRYWAKVKDVLPLIQNGPPSHNGPIVVGENYVTPAGWVSKATIKLEQFALQNPDSIIVVDAWDED